MNELFAVLRETARRQPEAGITLLDSRGRTASRKTFASLLQAAERYAGWIARAGVDAGQLVVIALPTSWEWLNCWLGALCRSAVPLALAPARGFGTQEADLRRIEAALERFRPALALVGEALLARPEAASTPHLARVGMTTATLSRLGTATATGDSEIAFMQLTSGTGGLPRAVPITPHAALHNLRAIDRALAETAGQLDAVVSWLPLHHDMGLVGALLFSLATGRDLTLLPPTAFLARPLVWFEHLARHERTMSLVPSFALEHCCDSLAVGPPRVDLSGWRVAICGAEMISAATVERFLAAFRPWRFAPAALRPAYGLAEATVGVTLDRRGLGVRTQVPPGGGTEVVCTGAPLAETQVRIAEPGPEGIGEVCVRGPAVCPSYLGEPADGAAGAGWLRTGDLGFLHEGELYLTGRCKEVLIVRGEKLMPQELEWVAETALGGRVRTAAFALPERGTEGAILVVETEERDSARRAAQARAIRAAVADSLALPLADLVFVGRGALPRTSSGKIRRAEVRDRYALRGGHR